jgi:hypothetical protein
VQCVRGEANNNNTSDTRQEQENQKARVGTFVNKDTDGGAAPRSCGPALSGKLARITCPRSGRFSRFSRLSHRVLTSGYTIAIAKRPLDGRGN